MSNETQTELGETRKNSEQQIFESKFDLNDVQKRSQRSIMTTKYSQEYIQNNKDLEGFMSMKAVAVKKKPIRQCQRQMVTEPSQVIKQDAKITKQVVLQPTRFSSPMAAGATQQQLFLEMMKQAGLKTMDFTCSIPTSPGIVCQGQNLKKQFTIKKKKIRVQTQNHIKFVEVVVGRDKSRGQTPTKIPCQLPSTPISLSGKAEGATIDSKRSKLSHRKSVLVEQRDETDDSEQESPLKIRVPRNIKDLIIPQDFISIHEMVENETQKKHNILKGEESLKISIENSNKPQQPYQKKLQKPQLNKKDFEPKDFMQSEFLTSEQYKVYQKNYAKNSHLSNKFKNMSRLIQYKKQIYNNPVKHIEIQAKKIESKGSPKQKKNLMVELTSGNLTIRGQDELITLNQNSPERPKTNIVIQNPLKVLALHKQNTTIRLDQNQGNIKTLIKQDQDSNESFHSIGVGAETAPQVRTPQKMVFTNDSIAKEVPKSAMANRSSLKFIQNTMKDRNKTPLHLISEKQNMKKTKSQTGKQPFYDINASFDQRIFENTKKQESIQTDLERQESMFHLTQKPSLFENSLKFKLLSARKKSNFNISPITNQKVSVIDQNGCSEQSQAKIQMILGIEQNPQKQIQIKRQSIKSQNFRIIDNSNPNKRFQEQQFKKCQIQALIDHQYGIRQKRGSSPVMFLSHKNKAYVKYPLPQANLTNYLAQGFTNFDQKQKFDFIINNY